MRMQRISRAPVLSATLSRVSFWITLLRPLEDLDQAPALGARHRPALDDAHEVALVGVVALVVGVHGARGAHDLAVAPMALGDVDADRDRLVRLVGDDLAEAHLRRAGAVVGGRRAPTLRRLLRPLLLPAAGARAGPLRRLLRALLLAAAAAPRGLLPAQLEAPLGRGRAAAATLRARRDAPLLRRPRARRGPGGDGRAGRPGGSGRPRRRGRAGPGRLGLPPPPLGLRAVG